MVSGWVSFRGGRFAPGLRPQTSGGTLYLSWGSTLNRDMYDEGQSNANAERSKFLAGIPRAILSGMGFSGALPVGHATAPAGLGNTCGLWRLSRSVSEAVRPAEEDEQEDHRQGEARGCSVLAVYCDPWEAEGTCRETVLQPRSKEEAIEKWGCSPASIACSALIPCSPRTPNLLPYQMALTVTGCNRGEGGWQKALVGSVSLWRRLLASRP